MLAMPTCVRHQIHHGLDALERHQRPQMPAMPRLAASPASTLLPTAPEPLSAGEAVGRGRLRCGRRVLLPQRELPLQIGDPFLGVRDLPFGVLQLPFTFGQFATKPLLHAENDDMVVLASEEISIRAVFPDPALVPQELQAKEVRWWLR